MSFPARLPGEANPNHKLDPSWVRWIRRQYDRHMRGKRGGWPERGRRHAPTLRSIAEEPGVSYETVRQIGLRRTWKHVPEES